MKEEGLWGESVRRDLNIGIQIFVIKNQNWGWRAGYLSYSSPRANSVRP